MCSKNLLKVAACILLLLVAQLSYSQERTVTGKVTDSKDGSAIPGVTVSAKGSRAAKQTNNDGTFSISIPSSVKMLVITSVGYAPQEVSVDGINSINVSLVVTNASLNEVVVIGYGTSKKKDLTGSIATISAKDFQSGVITTPEQLIAGKLAGVSIISNSGQPGAGSTIRIRGGASLRASNDPLVIIDGVQLDNGNISGAGNQLSFINPNDIESFTVLKDASATAIYGTRASNGVIIITTKKGKGGGGVKVNFSSVNSISRIVNKVDVLSADEFRAIVNAKGTAAQKAMMGGANTDWQDEIYQTAFATNNNISITGGLKKLPYRVSFGYQNQQGILITDKMAKTSMAISISPMLFSNHLKVDLNVKGSTEDTRFGNSNAIGGAITFDPTQPVRVKSNRFGGYFEWLANSPTGLDPVAGRNPVGQIEQSFNESNPVRSIGNLQLDYKLHFFPDLHINVNVGYDAARGSGTRKIGDSAASAYVASGKGGSVTKYKDVRSNSFAEFYLNYIKDIKSIRSRVDVLAGYSYYNYLTTNYYFPAYFSNGAINGSLPNDPYNKPRNTLISYYGRANFTFADRYLLTGTIRRDGSSRFNPNNRWGVFPSVAFAWKAKDETFLKNSKVISDLKLRLGYGITGQQDGIGNYDYLSYYSLSATGASYQFGNDFYQGFRPGGFYYNRKWEETTTSNLGLDYGFLNNRITGSIDFYIKKTTDLLNEIPQPAGTNFSAYIVANVGDMTNKGIEFSINATPIRNRNITWDVAYNITYNKNEITNLTVVPKDKNYVGFPGGGIQGGIGGGFAQINSVGYSKSTFFLYKQVYDSAGHPVEGVFVDLNKDGIINQNDLYRGKSAVPKVFMGFSTNVSYKKWNAGFVLRASIGNYVDNNNFSQTGTLAQLLGNSALYNASRSYLDTRFIGNSQELLSDYYVQNASFLKMDNFNIGYDLGKVYHNRATLKLNATIQNVFTITKYKGLDPELSSGIDNNLYPRPRIYAIGLNLDF